ncbi:hypothetical protein PAMA_003097 [Pampus argenteus]
MWPFTSNGDAANYPEISLSEKHKEQDSEDYLLLICFLPPTGAEESNEAVRSKEREKRSLPYWGLWSSDFYSWLEELQAQAAYDGMRDLAHTFWAHFPISSELGYDSPESHSQLEE